MYLKAEKKKTGPTYDYTQVVYFMEMLKLGGVVNFAELLHMKGQKDADIEERLIFFYNYDASCRQKKKLLKNVVAGINSSSHKLERFQTNSSVPLALTRDVCNIFLRDTDIPSTEEENRLVFLKNLIDKRLQRGQQTEFACPPVERVILQLPLSQSDLAALCIDTGTKTDPDIDDDQGGVQTSLHDFVWPKLYKFTKLSNYGYNRKKEFVFAAKLPSGRVCALSVGIVEEKGVLDLHAVCVDPAFRNKKLASRCVEATVLACRKTAHIKFIRCKALNAKMKAILKKYEFVAESLADTHEPQHFGLKLPDKTGQEQEEEEEEEQEQEGEKEEEEDEEEEKDEEEEEKEEEEEEEEEEQEGEKEEEEDEEEGEKEEEEDEEEEKDGP